MSIPLLRHHPVHLGFRLDPFGPFLLALIIFCIIVIAGVGGFMFLEGWDFLDSVYQVVITLSTVGFQEVHPLSKAGRVFTTLLILFGVGNFMFMAGAFTQLLVEGRLQQAIGRRRVQKHIDRLEGHFIVCGFGRIGCVVAREIQREGHPVVVIDSNADVSELLTSEGFLHLIGDATSDELLLKAGIKRARSLIVALSHEADNVYVVLTARQLHPSLNIVARTGEEHHIPRLERAGADRVVMPHVIGGLRMAQSVLRPTVISFMELALRGQVDLQAEELLVSPGSPLAGKSLVQSEVRQRFNIMVIAIKKPDQTLLFNPSAEDVIEAGDTLLTVGGKDHLKSLMELL